MRGIHSNKAPRYWGTPYSENDLSNQPNVIKIKGEPAMKRQALTGKVLPLALVFVTAACGSIDISAAESSADPVNATQAPEEVVVFAAQKFWAATWDVLLLDSQVVLPGPVVRTHPRSSQSGTEVIPITTIGAQFKGISLSSSYFSKTAFTTKDDTATTANRTEWDVTLGYALLPTLTASIAYREGTVNEGSTANTRALTGASGGFKVKGRLLGFSANAPLWGSLALYSNFAFGKLKSEVDAGSVLGTPTYDGTYRIGEVGLSYRLLGASAQPGFVKSVSANLGYRAQVIGLKGFDYPVLSIPGGTPVGNQKTDIRSTTDGLILGVAAAF